MFPSARRTGVLLATVAGSLAAAASASAATPGLGALPVEGASDAGAVTTGSRSFSLVLAPRDAAGLKAFLADPRHAQLTPAQYAARFGPSELLIRVDGSTLDVTRGDGPVDLAFAAGPGIRRVISGELAPGRAIETGVVEVLHGRGELLGRFASTFHLAA
jgi:hypothetical protein